MGRAGRISSLSALAAAILVAALGVPQPASAKGPCGKVGARCRLIKKVTVTDVTSHSAVVSAGFSGEGTYEVELQAKGCPHKTCRAHPTEVVATGTVSGEETIDVDLTGLVEQRGYAVRVTATSGGRTEQSKPVKFATS